MKKFKASLFHSRSLTVALGCLIAVATTARAEDMVRYKGRPVGNKVRIDGAANVHNWAMEGSTMGGYLEVPAGVTLDSAQAAIAGAADGKIRAKAEVFIPVNSINNVDHYEKMDSVMYEAMNSDQYPRIQFHLTDLALKQPHKAGTPLEFDAKGDLSFNGVTNQIAMPVTIQNADKGQLKISASGIPIKMTDYKVKPPVNFKLFVTDPLVKISFDWLVGPPKPAATK